MLCQPSSRRSSPRPSRAPLRGRRQWECGNFKPIRSQPSPRKSSLCPNKTPSKTACGATNFRRCDQSNQQYSVTALTDTTATISERYAYDAYGKLKVLDGGGTVLSGSAYGNRYTYTGREWDEELGLYHYRARMYSPDTGRFVSRDPIGFNGGLANLYCYVGARPYNRTDPLGLKACKITIYVGHNYRVKDLMDGDYGNPNGTIEDGDPFIIPDGHCIAGVGCGFPVDSEDDNGEGNTDSIQDYLEEFYPCNTISAPNLCKYDDPANGLPVELACRMAKYAKEKARAAARRILKGGKPNPRSGKCTFDCESVTIQVKCGPDMTKLSEDGIWEGEEVPAKIRNGCRGICGYSTTIKR